MVNAGARAGRQTCFCELFGSATIACNRCRSPDLTVK